MRFNITPFMRLKGCKPLCQSQKTLLATRKNRLYLLDLKTLALRRAGGFALSARDRVIAAIPIFRRIFRFGVRCAHQLSAGNYLLSYGGNIHYLDVAAGTVTLERETRPGFQPLHFSRIGGLSGFDEVVCYGDYGGNHQRREVGIHGRYDSGEWVKLYTFPPGKIEHIHSIVADPYRDCVWIFTGDYGSAAGIWMAVDNFKTVVPILTGKQAYRASRGYPLPGGVLYATDSHLESNSIRLLFNQNGRWTTTNLHPMRGSSLYATRLKNLFFFSTAVEPGRPLGNRVMDLVDMKPGPGIMGRWCEVVAGNPDIGFKRVLRWRADVLPKRLFQLSTIRFPVNSGNDTLLTVYGTGCRGINDATELFRFSKA